MKNSVDDNNTILLHFLFQIHRSIKSIVVKINHLIEHIFVRNKCITTFIISGKLLKQLEIRYENKGQEWHDAKNVSKLPKL